LIFGSVVQAAGSGPVDLAVHYLGAADRAVDLVEQLHARLPMLTECLVSEVGAAIGAHAGPGMLGVVVLPGGLREQFAAD
jgi:fatty acid kinase fatty acid binding subunit